MSARDRILKRVRSGRESLPAVESWVYPPQQSDLAARFIRALTAAGGEAYLVNDLKAAWKFLAVVLKDLDARRVMYNQEPPLNQNSLEIHLPQVEWIAAGSGDISRQACQEAEIGLTGALFGLAETGSVGIAGNSTSSRLVSLLPPVHIVLLDQRLLVPDLISWESIRPERLPSQLVLVSGPSKTADIEQTLVVGAHGPKQFTVIIYGS
jgi:L-lactate dehydrogenase complex protein LldG